MPVAEVKTSGGGGGSGDGSGGGSGGGSDGERNLAEKLLAHAHREELAQEAGGAQQEEGDEDDAANDNPDHKTANELYRLCGLDKLQITKVRNWPTEIQKSFDGFIFSTGIERENTRMETQQRELARNEAKNNLKVHKRKTQVEQLQSQKTQLKDSKIKLKKELNAKQMADAWQTKQKKQIVVIDNQIKQLNGKIAKVKATESQDTDRRSALKTTLELIAKKQKNISKHIENIREHFNRLESQVDQGLGALSSREIKTFIRPADELDETTLIPLLDILQPGPAVNRLQIKTWCAKNVAAQQGDADTAGHVHEPQSESQAIKKKETKSTWFEQVEEFPSIPSLGPCR
jgi:hypothetical protein